MKYKVILFDVDDTLFDFSMSEKKALNKTFVDFGLPMGLVDYEDSYKEINRVLWRDLEQGILTLSELGVERFRRLFLAHKLEINADIFNSIYLGYLGTEIHMVSGAVDLCNTLADCRLAIITNGFTDVQKSRIKGSPLCDTFEHIIISEEAGFQKPARGIFDYAFSKLQITDKESVLIIGDSLTSDIQGGINYGIDTCWFNPYCKENNIGIKPTYEIRDLTDIIRIVGKAGN
ncbi:YjjG family noncanonical pyrimidine nucleotidase [Bacillus pseudomycoides]|uniref:Noncanonical pyrimidine nucleotidase, YjjG family n=1 Tax=Bacillus pseudomycoides TaxID=64104 RepID=A0A2C3VEM7_9BACI|nr:YjjG family noncanonical pyrimidine nucleotidase [Bacillus pseudomycoides]PDY44197.1 noncanonical pyrimidine nucleotidase, YjjG family [Bacillus pseudomycoides]PEA81523.1 noncanonical pyrimidine nucleotidase, YjjG family [Bacillus pseudomycoides]PED69256.1 noncanonical pyrimidine nucleotidase, YjjG family [Bacillus pseudomycoides]PEI36781.1 noncanonical pyrimidine nucleotidase, YjjG family [Bacillus pseudomycoides]PEJ70203.1 noncanonical pyrimidine nucleotidase, YjjG family [Bacillus pseudo